MATKLQELPLDERLKLVQDLWDSIAAKKKTSRSRRHNAGFLTKD